jgi:protein-S-isoprenylcysteine O-methyltransferase Ste14
MTNNGYIVCGLFILAILINCTAVYLQKRHSIYDKFGRNAHNLHAAIISVFWLFFIVSYVWLETQTPAGTAYSDSLIATFLKVIAVLLFYLSIKQIGVSALTNKDLFTNKRRKLSGVYLYIREPIYLSYTIFIFASGMATGIEAFYYMSIISFIGLQFIEAKIESL